MPPKLEERSPRIVFCCWVAWSMITLDWGSAELVVQMPNTILALGACHGWWRLAPWSWTTWRHSFMRVQWLLEYLYSLARQPITQHGDGKELQSPWAHYLRSYLIVSRVYTRSFTQVFSSQQWSYAYAAQFRRTILLHWNRGALTCHWGFRSTTLLSLVTTLCIELQVTQAQPCLFKQLQLLTLQFISPRVSAYAGAGVPSR